MPHRPRSSLLRLLTQAVLTTLAITTGGALLVVGSAGMADVPETDRAAAARGDLEAPAPVSTPASRLMKRYDCSTTGFAPDAEPRSALVRSPGGKVRVVSFEQGWAVHTAGDNAGDGAGDEGTVLVAVCLRPAR